MSQRRLPLAEIKRKLKSAPQRSLPEAEAGADDAQLFRAATADVRTLKPDDHANIQPKRPAPVPLRKGLEKEEPAPAVKKTDDWIPASWLHEKPDQVVLEGDALDLAKALQGVKPIASDRVELDRPKPKPLPVQRERDEQSALHESIYAPTSLDLHLEGGDELVYLANGVPRAVVRDLRRGRWVVQDQLDLHGCNRDEARDLLAACMGQWRKRGVRCVRVIHGKGRGSPGREPVLKKLVAGWLINYEDVMVYCQARLPEGGAGALIVLLKASRTGPGPLL